MFGLGIWALLMSGWRDPPPSLGMTLEGEGLATGQSPTVH